VGWFRAEELFPRATTRPSWSKTSAINVTRSRSSLSRLCCFMANNKQTYSWSHDASSFYEFGLMFFGSPFCCPAVLGVEFSGEKSERTTRRRRRTVFSKTNRPSRISTKHTDRFLFFASNAMQCNTDTLVDVVFNHYSITS
jgi:hypothetical protein